MARLLCTVSYKIPIQKEDIGTMQRDSGLSQDIFRDSGDLRKEEGRGGREEREREREACI